MTYRNGNSSVQYHSKSVSERVAKELKRHIASGEFAPGDRLPGERQLSEALNVSRVSVRAALQKLKAQGLVSAVQGGGTRVIAKAPQLDSPLAGLVLENQENLQDLVNLRTVMLRWAADKAVINHTSTDIVLLDEILQKMRASSKASEVSMLDLKFYAILFKTSGSAVFLHLTGVIDDIIMTVMFEADIQQRVSEDDCRFFVQCAERALNAMKTRQASSLRTCIEENSDRRATLMLSEQSSDNPGYQQAAE